MSTENSIAQVLAQYERKKETNKAEEATAAINAENQDQIKALIAQRNGVHELIYEVTKHAKLLKERDAHRNAANTAYKQLTTNLEKSDFFPAAVIGVPEVLSKKEGQELASHEKDELYHQTVQGLQTTPEVSSISQALESVPSVEAQIRESEPILRTALSEAGITLPENIAPTVVRNKEGAELPLNDEIRQEYSVVPELKPDELLHTLNEKLAAIQAAADTLFENTPEGRDQQRENEAIKQRILNGVQVNDELTSLNNASLIVARDPSSFDYELATEHPGLFLEAVRGLASTHFVKPIDQLAIESMTSKDQESLAAIHQLAPLRKMLDERGEKWDELKKQFIGIFFPDGNISYNVLSAQHFRFSQTVVGMPTPENTMRQYFENYVKHIIRRFNPDKMDPYTAYLDCIPARDNNQLSLNSPQDRFRVYAQAAIDEEKSVLIQQCLDQLQNDAGLTKEVIAALNTTDSIQIQEKFRTLYGIPEQHNRSLLRIYYSPSRKNNPTIAETLIQYFTNPADQTDELWKAIQLLPIYDPDKEIFSHNGSRYPNSIDSIEKLNISDIDPKGALNRLEEKKQELGETLRRALEHSIRRMTDTDEQVARLQAFSRRFEQS